MQWHLPIGLCFFEDYIVNFYHAETHSIDFDTQVFRDLMAQWKAYCQHSWVKVKYNHNRHTWGTMQLADISINQGISRPFLVPAYTSETFPYTVVAQPVFPGQETYAMGRNNKFLSIHAKSNQKELASDFLAYLSSYDEKHKYPIWYDQAIIYQFQGEEDYPPLSPEEDVYHSDDSAIFLDHCMQEYMQVVGKTRVPVLS